MLCEHLQHVLQHCCRDAAMDVDTLDHLGVASNKVGQVSLDGRVLVVNREGLLHQVEREVVSCRVDLYHPVLAHEPGAVPANQQGCFAISARRQRKTPTRRSAATKTVHQTRVTPGLGVQLTDHDGHGRVGNHVEPEQRSRAGRCATYFATW